MNAQSDFQWLVEHDAELFQKYRSRWIAVWNGRIIGSGVTATEAVKQAEAVAPGEDYTLEAFDSDADVIYGGV